jgi:hypothetical protein
MVKSRDHFTKKTAFLNKSAFLKKTTDSAMLMDSNLFH